MTTVAQARTTYGQPAASKPRVRIPARKEPTMPETNLPTTEADVVDALAKLRDEKKQMEIRESELLAELGPLQERAYTGHEYVMTVKMVSRTTLDQDAVRERLGSEWCERHEKISVNPRKTFAARAERTGK